MFAVILTVYCIMNQQNMLSNKKYFDVQAQITLID